MPMLGNHFQLLYLSTGISQFAGGGDWIRTSVGVSQQIYSLPPLATRAPLQKRVSDYAIFSLIHARSHKSFYQSIAFLKWRSKKWLAKAKWPHPKKGRGARMADKGEG